MTTHSKGISILSKAKTPGKKAVKILTHIS
uniref:Uncharacterized protein n=1 Tax=Arundo donax TaxID=35708 RepID=A0A0A9DGV0_ARUDO